MKILVIGGSGTIGKKIVEFFSKEHQVIVAGRSSKDYPVDIADTKSIKELYKKVKETGKVDAIICAAGEAKWAPFKDLSETDFHIGLRSKLMGQVNVVRYGHKCLKKKGSITLTTGILADDPVYQTTSAAMVNGGIHSFVQAVAIEMRKKIRVNVVSSGVVVDAYHKYESYFPGHPPIPMEKMIMGYRKSVSGRVNGEVIRIYS
ncbi:short chain dehydrogenase [Aquimarina sp. AD10]|uniref:short chain dehydrogenase n=1 Tax=Aquimarina TaxID=290174 RepID=UPI000E54B97A|nr:MULTISPECIES: short chain dehydrogenase [Aquimarina]AXT63075.1 short chain dehydrogenase [Aquimarina sp. AD10]RKM96876.1 short chain dehydrogenase [Aquimarina sp. AD10]